MLVVSLRLIVPLQLVLSILLVSLKIDIQVRHLPILQLICLQSVVVINDAGGPW